jgi:hypothetical protein
MAKRWRLLSPRKGWDTLLWLFAFEEKSDANKRCSSYLEGDGKFEDSVN